MPGEVSLNTFVITRLGLCGSCVGFTMRGKMGWLQISRGTGVCLGGRGPAEDRGSGFSPCSIPARPGGSAQAPSSSLVLQWGCPIASPSEIVLQADFFFFPVHGKNNFFSMPSCLLPNSSFGWKHVGRERWLPTEHVPEVTSVTGAFGVRGCSKKLTMGMWQAHISPSAWGRCPSRCRKLRLQD